MHYAYASKKIDNKRKDKKPYKFVVPNHINNPEGTFPTIYTGISHS